jgi:hypothetical protein
LGPINQIIISYCSLGRSRTHDLLARRIVLCGTKSLHKLMCLFLIVAVSHSGHIDSLARGIVVCYTKSVGAPHGGHGVRVVCTPVEWGRARCCGDSSKFLLARGLVAVCTPPHPSPSSPADPRLDLLPHSCPTAQ